MALGFIVGLRPHQNSVMLLQIVVGFAVQLILRFIELHFCSVVLVASNKATGVCIAVSKVPIIQSVNLASFFLVVLSLFRRTTLTILAFGLWGTRWRLVTRSIMRERRGEPPSNERTVSSTEFIAGALRVCSIGLLVG